MDGIRGWGVMGWWGMGRWTDGWHKRVGGNVGLVGYGQVDRWMA